MKKGLYAGVASAVAAFMAAGSVAHAADEPTAVKKDSGTAIGEVVVTARKRSESLQKIPVAVTAQTGAQLQQQRVVQPTDLSRVAPSLQIQHSNGSDNSAQIALRGQYAGDSLLGVSQPVGLYEDNVNLPHPFGSNNGFFDLNRVEVLRGPQGTLYGRNTTGGAINVITKDADYNGIHGFVEGEFGSRNDQKFGAAVNVPIIQDVLTARLAYQNWQQDGFGESLITHQKFGDDHDDQIARLSVRFDPASNFTANLKAEYGKANHTGVMISNPSLTGASAWTVDAGVLLWDDFATWGPTVASALAGNTTAQSNIVTAAGPLLATCIGKSIYVNCSATNQFDNLITWHGGLDMKWDINEYVTARSITGVHMFKNTKLFDLDSIQSQQLEVGGGSPGTGLAPDAPGQPPIPFNLGPDQTSTQWSQEFNLSGKFDKLNWLVGAYASWDRGHGAQTSLAAEELQYAGGYYFYGLTSPYMQSHDGILNKSDTWALYTQEDYKFNDVVSLTLGARYTEEKILQNLANWNYYSNPADNPANPGGTDSYACTGANYNASTGVVTASGYFLPPDPTNPESCAEDVRSTGPGGIFSHSKSNGISYLASLNFQLTPSMLMYVKTARGFRGGAFGRSQQIPAKPETDTDYEIGLKSDWFDHRLRVNLAAYQTNYENKQVSALQCNDGSPPPCSGGFTTILLNAATARIQGVEWDWQARVFQHLTLYGNGSFTNPTYTRYPGAVTGAGAPYGDASGLDLATVPHWQHTWGGRYERPIGPGTLGVQADYAYRGELPTTPLVIDNGVPIAVWNKMREGVGLLNGRVDYTIPDWGMTVAFWGTNLLDKEYYTQSLTSGFTAGLATALPGAPRTLGIQVRKTFGQE